MFFLKNYRINFTHYYLTQCFYYVIRNPIHIYVKLRSKFDSQQKCTKFLNEFSNNDIGAMNEKGAQIENTTKDWSTNVLSWTNLNVINTFRSNH